MSVPSLGIQQQGVTVLSADQANTYVQGGALYATLQAFTGLPNMTVTMIGTATAGDGGQGEFYWNAASVAADDGGVTTIAPNGVTIGRWLRLSNAWDAGYVSHLGNNLSLSSGTLTASGTIGVSSVASGSGLAGGPITTTGTLSLAAIVASRLFGNPGTVSAVPSPIVVGSGLTLTTGGTLTATVGEWSGGTVTALGGGLSISGTTLSDATAAFSIGSYLWAQYQVAATPTVGTAYAGDTLYNAATGSSFSLSAGQSWRCMGVQNAYSGSGPVYSTALFLRLS